MKCAAHPEVDTNLACGKCDIPICPKCLVQTPVGMRCRKCARLKRLPTFEITPQQYLKALAVGLGCSLGLGIAWASLWSFVSFFNFFIAAGVGYATAEVLGLSVNRKRGRSLQVIAAVCVIVTFIIANVGLSGGALTLFDDFSLYDVAALALGIIVAVTRLQ
ncbi:MAG: hypothetical protein FJ012_10525 [Chloroflexi bacterium]|nr:hypothetical protein [Chloroflexota bacterium]